MRTRIIPREDGSADLIIEGQGRRVDGTLAIECDSAQHALILEKVFNHALGKIRFADTVALGAMGEDVPDNIFRFAQ